MKLIQIHTDSDFWVAYKGIKIGQFNECVHITVKKEQLFIDAVYSGHITSNNMGVLYDMCELGNGDYGNYSYTIVELPSNYIQNIGV